MLYIYKDIQVIIIAHCLQSRNCPLRIALPMGLAGRLLLSATVVSALLMGRGSCTVAELCEKDALFPEKNEAGPGGENARSSFGVKSFCQRRGYCHQQTLQALPVQLLKFNLEALLGEMDPSSCTCFGRGVQYHVITEFRILCGRGERAEVV
ncbi:hypothetical protein VKS41_000699 [Umbelopsis sp. WA50703]|jgi:hypothetical protein